jgi:hypothetical protein
MPAATAKPINLAGGGLQDWRFSISHLSAARARGSLRGAAVVARGSPEMNNPAL